MKPKAEFYDSFIEHGKNLSFRDTANLIGITQTELIQLLIDKKYLYRNVCKELRAYKDKLECGYFEHKVWKNNSKSGIQVLVTPKGLERFKCLINDNKTSCLFPTPILHRA